MEKYVAESVQLNEELWRAWVQKGKLRDAKARIRARWIGGSLGVAALVAVIGLFVFRA